MQATTIDKVSLFSFLVYTIGAHFSSSLLALTALLRFLQLLGTSPRLVIINLDELPHSIKCMWQQGPYIVLSELLVRNLLFPVEPYHLHAK